MNDTTPIPTIQDIQAAVARRFRVTVLDLCSRRQGIAVARPRQIAMWIARHTTVHTLTEIGRAFGDRDHSTVIQAIATIDRLMAREHDISSAVWAIVDNVNLREGVMLRRAMLRAIA